MKWTIKSADYAFSKYIRQRDPWCFFLCGNPSTDNSHYWPRGAMSTRYDPENCDGACRDCHTRHEGQKKHIYKELKLKQLGKVRYDALEKRYHTLTKNDLAIMACKKLLEAQK